MSLELPGFRFHPTEQELIDFYLLNAVTGNSACFHIIGFLNIYNYDPGQLPKLAMNGEREWYFLVPRERKVGGGGRPNRATGNGFWKATGSDRKIISSTGHKRVIGLRKTLVFYRGKAPQGKKTDWVMNEYRLPDNSPLVSKEVVLCKIYRKATPLKVMEQRAAMEENLNLVRSAAVFQSKVMIDQVSISFNVQDHKELVQVNYNMQNNNITFKMEEEEEDHVSGGNKVEDNVEREERVAEVFKREKLGELQVPKSNFNLDWLTQDAVWSHQLNSPWLQNLITPNFPSIINLF